MDRLALLKHAGGIYPYLAYFDSNDYPDRYGAYNWLMMAGRKKGIEVRQPDPACWDLLHRFTKHTGVPFVPGLLCYDLKNTTEELRSEHHDASGFPLMAFFEPEWIIGETRSGVPVRFNCPDELIRQSRNTATASDESFPPAEMQSGFTPEEYRRRFERIQQYIRRGDMYEMNFCQQFSAVVPRFDPVSLYGRINRHSPAPFSALLKYDYSWLICSSPERFLAKRGSGLISQPIKGTCRRTGDEVLDQALAEELRTSAKERNENLMIVDIVRNDLSHYAVPGSIQAEELCGIYPFATVQHMISTITAKLKPDAPVTDAIAAAFPMGSMTGAPKISAMQIAEEMETFQRRLYSGAVGFFTGSGDLDLNVVIRSFTWNEQNGVLSFGTGSAVTALADAEQEYRECLLKAEALLHSLHFA